VPTVFLQHTRMSSEGSTHEQESHEVRGEVGIANQSSPTGFFLESTTSSNSYSSPIDQARPQPLEETPGSPPRVSSIPEYRNIIAVATSAIVAMDHREEYLSGYLSPTTIPWQTSSSPTEPHHRRALLTTDSVHRGNSLSVCSPS
jgi:hypothetical protein